MTKLRRLPFVPLVLVAVLALVVAIPTFAADPSPGPGKQTAPGQQKAKAAEAAVTITGSVAKSTDANGKARFTLTAGGKTYELSAGPAWYWGDKNPLNAYVGKSVEIKGTQREGSTEINVQSIDGKALRSAGKPPWAGGPGVVGPSHPGWKSWMADGKPGRGLGREHAPGQNKDTDAPAASDDAGS